MDRIRPVYTRQKSNSTTPLAPTSPIMSPFLHHGHHVRSGSTGLANAKKGQNQAAKAAAQRLAQVMAHQSLDDEDEEDDISFDYLASGTSGIRLSSGRATKSRSPLTIRTTQEQPTSGHAGLGVRSSQSVNVTEQPLSARSSLGSRPSHSDLIVEQPPSARSSTSSRSSQFMNTIEQPPSARSTLVGRSNLGVKTMPSVPPSVPMKTTLPITPTEGQIDSRRDKRLSLDMGSMIFRDTSNRPSNSSLQDELDMVQEENENLLEKLRLAEERSEEAEARARQLENQVATIGEGVTLEARLLSKKEAALQQREAALRVASQSHGGSSNQLSALRTEAEIARDEATSALERLHEAEAELQSLRIMTYRMILSKEEMEEVVLKRCWLVRYWSLCIRYGIHAEIAGARFEYWSSLTRNPVEVVLAAGQKAKEEMAINDLEGRENLQRDLNEFSSDANAESLLSVERGLRELATLKVEDAVALAMARDRRANLLKSDELKLPSEGYFDAFELSHEESEDVSFKQAWLAYFWRRAKNHDLEPDIADERLQFWIKNNKPSTSQDAVDVERGLIELRKLGIETQLWEISRKGLLLNKNLKTPTQSDF